VSLPLTLSLIMEPPFAAVSDQHGRRSSKLRARLVARAAYYKA